MITLEQLLALRSLAKSTANTDAACAVMRYLLEVEPVEKSMAFDFFCDTFSESFVPFYTYKKYESALAECDKEAADELTRLNDEFERTDAYERQIERYNRLNQLRVLQPFEPTEADR